MKSEEIETLRLELSRNEGFCLLRLLGYVNKEEIEGNLLKTYDELNEILNKFDK